MKRFVRHLFGSLFAAGSALLMIAAPGCADNESTLFIRQAQIAQSTSGGGCTVDSSPTSKALMGGIMDVAFATQYGANLLVGNQLVDRGSRDHVKTETSRVQLEGSEVYLTDSAGRQLGAPFTVPGIGFIDPASGSNPSYGVLKSVLVDSVTGSKLRAEMSALPYGTVRRITAHVKVFGRSLGGLEVESGEWNFPIEVCYGCLVSFPPEAINQATTPPSCSTGQDATDIKQPCSIGQDDPVDCRLCMTTASDKSICQPVIQ